MRSNRLFAAVFAALLSASALAELAVPPLTGRVVDRAGMLSPEEEQRIAEALAALEAAPGGAQAAVLTIPRLEGDALELFSMRVVEAWKLGDKATDNGLLLLIVRDERKMRIETGYGLEGRLNDARCGDIIRAMGPYFRAHQYEQGVLFALSETGAILTGQRLTAAPVPAAARSRRSHGDERFMFLVFVVLFVVLPWFLQWRRGRGTTIFYGGYGGFRGSHRGGFSGGFRGGGFSGGGGSFGGGGASGGW